jgi:hypothetical protein
MMITLMRSIQAEAVPRFSALGQLTSTASVMRLNEAVMIINEIHIDTHRRYAPM